MSLLWFWIAALSLWIDSSTCLPLQLDEDEACTSSSGRPGICTRLNSCLSALAAIRSRSEESVVRCGFLGFEEIVCCPQGREDADESREDLSSGETSEEDSSGRVIRQHGDLRKSERVCQQYRDSEQKRVGYFILNGEEASVGEFPHMAALGFLPPGETTMSWRCGGTLISDRYVLTAAHCVSDRRTGSPKMVRLGQNDINAVSSEGSDYPVDRLILHPNYKKKFNYDDIALVRLARAVKFSENISPACLYSKDEDPNNELIATGWGAVESSGFSKSARLLKTTVSAVPQDSCQDSYKRMSKIPNGVRDDMLCAGDPQGQSDTCQGDSGGPLQLLEDSRSSVYSVVGVTSFGPNPCGGRKPSIYARVSSYTDWIESNVWP